MTEYEEASVLTAKRAAQHIRLSRGNDVYEHLCILTLLPSLGPLHLMLADTPWPHGFGATLASVGTLSEGFERFDQVLLVKQSFPTALQVAILEPRFWPVIWLLSPGSVNFRTSLFFFLTN